jgi:hypothetical protein
MWLRRWHSIWSVGHLLALCLVFLTLFVGWLTHLRGSEPLDDFTTIGFMLVLLAVHVFNWLVLVGLTFARGKPVGAILLFFFGSGPLYYPLLASILSHRLNKIHEANGLSTGSFSWPHHPRVMRLTSPPAFASTVANVAVGEKSWSTMRFQTGAIVLLSVSVLYLLSRLRDLEEKLTMVERNSAIAVLSAERAHSKIGAFAPCFGDDPQTYVRADIENSNLPLAVFSDDVLIPLRQAMDKRHPANEDLERSMLHYWRLRE